MSNNKVEVDQTKYQMDINCIDYHLKMSMIEKLIKSKDLTVVDILGEYGFIVSKDVISNYNKMIVTITDLAQSNKEMKMIKPKEEVLISEDLISMSVPSLVNKDNEIQITELSQKATVDGELVSQRDYMNIESTSFSTVIKTNSYDKDFPKYDEHQSKIKPKKNEFVEPDKELVHVEKMSPLLLADASEGKWVELLKGDKVTVYKNMALNKDLTQQRGNIFYIFNLNIPNVIGLNKQVMLVGRDCTNTKDDESIALDLVMNRKLATGLGFQSIATNLVMIPIIRQSKDKSFKPGGYSNLLGSLQRRTSNLIDFNSFNLMSNDIYSAYYDGNKSFIDVVEIAVKSLMVYFESIFINILSNTMKKVDGFGVVKFDGESKINMNDKITNKLFKRCSDLVATEIKTCVNKCKEARCGERKLMYGSRVAKIKNEYILPCGDKVLDLDAYYRHPCAIRGKCIQFANHNSVGREGVDSELHGYKSSLCFRVYSYEDEAKMCTIFCNHIGYITFESYKDNTNASKRYSSSILSADGIKREDIKNDVEKALSSLSKKQVIKF